MYDVIIIGGGPAGMAAAISASDEGGKTLITERGEKLGGILNQCIHNGFGLHYFKEELTGPEYANRFWQEVKSRQIDVMLGTLVTGIDVDNKILTTHSERGIEKIQGKAIVLAMGCRERTAGAIFQCGNRPAGVYTAGSAQKICNEKGRLVGKNIVILGSGDIGLIMARRMTFEGAKVQMVLELMPYSSGLKRNIAQCLNDFDIPLLFSHTVTKVVGEKRVEGVFIAEVDEKLMAKKETERFVPCDCLLLSVGLIPENDLIFGKGIAPNPATQGVWADEFRRTSKEGIFSCGNVLHVHDLADNASFEAKIAGKSGAKFAKGEHLPSCDFEVSGKGHVLYVMPQKVSNVGDKVTIFFRVGEILRNKKILVKCGEEVIFKKAALVLAPGEMEEIAIDKSLVTSNLTVEVE